MGLYGLKEVFHLARQLEENVQFYFRAAAEQCDDPEIATLCLRIAEQEAKHRQDLSRIERQLLEKEGNVSITWAELGWLELDLEEGVLSDTEEVKSLVEGATVADIMEKAIQIERDSVTFYSRLISEIEPSCREALEEIIEEERNHIDWLQQHRLDEKL